MRFVRATIGIGLLVAIWLGFSVARNIAAQLSGRTDPPAAQSTASADDGALVMKHKVAKTSESPLVSDVRDAAGVILPQVPPEPQLVEYVGAVESPIVDIDAVSDEFRNQTPEAVVAGNDVGATGFRNSRMSPGASFGGGASGGLGGGSVAKATGSAATASAVESGSGDARLHLLGHQASDAASAQEAPTQAAATTSASGGSGSGAGSGGSASGDAVANSSTPTPSGGAAGGAASESGAATSSSEPTATTPAANGRSSTAASADSPVASNTGAIATGATAGDAFDLDVPEPALLLLIGLGLTAIARRRQAARRV